MTDFDPRKERERMTGTAIKWTIIFFSLMVALAIFGYFCQDAQGSTYLQVVGDTCDAYVQSYGGTSYLTWHDAAAANYISTTISDVRVGQVEEGSNWYIRRWLLELNTATLPDAAIVKAGTLFVYSKTDYTEAGCDFYLSVVQGTYECGIAAAEWDEFNPGVAGSLSTSGLATGEYVAIPLTPDSLNSWLDKTGNSQLAIVADEDIDSDEPADEESWVWEFETADENGKEPYLNLWYVVPMPGSPDTVQAEQQSSERVYKKYLHDTTPELRCFITGADTDADSIKWRVGTTVDDDDMWAQDWYDITNITENNWTEEISYGGDALTEGTLYFFGCMIRGTDGDSSSWSTSDTLRYIADDTIIWVNRNDTECLVTVIDDDETPGNTTVDSFAVSCDNWREGGVAYWVTQDTARDNYPDSDGDYPVFNWGFIMHPMYIEMVQFDGLDYHVAANCIWDTVSALWGSALIADGDEFSIHYHNDEFGNPGLIWSLDTTFDSLQFAKFLRNRLYYGEQMDDKFGMFSMNYNGRNWGDSALFAFMDKRIRGDWTNVSTGDYWGSAQEGYYPYHPSVADYEAWGDMQIYIGRVNNCGDYACMTVGEILGVFDSCAAIEGKGYGILSIFDHDWQTNNNTFQDNFDVTYGQIKAVAESTGIPFIYLTATEAMARFFGWTDVTAPTFTFSIVNANSLEVSITEAGDVYSDFPYAVHFNTGDDSTELVKMVQVGATDVWRWGDSGLDSIIVSVVDTCGNMVFDWAYRDWIDITQKGRRRRMIQELGGLINEKNDWTCHDPAIAFGSSGLGLWNCK